MPPNPLQQSATSSLKRKQPPSSSQSQDFSRKKRRVKAQDARLIISQTTGKAFGDGEVDIDKFVKARQFEIKALEDGMRRSKGALTTRAFQNVPRDLRRRTASHNAKRVPKRLRARAKKEMVEDNTPTVTSKKRKPSPNKRLRLDTVRRLKRLNKTTKEAGEDVHLRQDTVEETASKRRSQPSITSRVPRVKSNTLQKPPKPKAKFRKRQIFKSWLPTHLFHAKRAHMTPPKEPLWRMAVALSPTVKSYRPTHRASTARGAVAWDMSYISTIGMEGSEKSLKGLFRALGVRGQDIKDCSDGCGATKWTTGSRSWSGWVHEREQPRKPIAPVTIIWCAEGQTLAGNDTNSKAEHGKTRKSTRRVLLRVHPAGFLQLWEEMLRLAKVQKPVVMLEDLRFEIGSIEITGPSATEALVGSLWPLSNGHEGTLQGTPENVWPTLRNLTNPASLPSSIVLAFDISDPRLHHPPHKVVEAQSQTGHQSLLDTLTTWPVDKTQGPAGLFDRAARFAACRQLPSQKAVNRRKALAAPGEYPTPQSKDPRIPVVLMVSRSVGSNTGSWTVMLPWKCVLPVWYAIMYFPITSGGTARFGGLDEKKQTSFETGTPWFPGDYPGTAAGMAWEQQERDKRKEKWEKRPKGKRIEWESLNLGKDRKGEIGLGWACHWEHLINKSCSLAPEDELKARQLGSSEAMALLSTFKVGGPIEGVSKSLFNVKIDMVTRGVMIACARIYRLPSKDMDLRQQWLSLLPSLTRSVPKGSQRPQALSNGSKSHDRRQILAAGLLGPTNDGKVEGSSHPFVPDEEDLVGFITTGNFNLGEGRGTGMGCLLMSKILEVKIGSFKGGKAMEERLCIVREAGQAIGRLARWTVV